MDRKKGAEAPAVAWSVAGDLTVHYVGGFRSEPRIMTSLSERIVSRGSRHGICGSVAWFSHNETMP